jgi:Ca2+-binding EF-hand superfamily protein
MIGAVSGVGRYDPSSLVQMRQQMFNAIDTDGDGKHSKDEIGQMMAQGPQGGPSVDEIFEKGDTDGDGYISETEYEAFAPSGPPMEGGNGGMGGMAGISSADFMAQMFNAIDTDGDGKHSKDEISRMVAQGPQGGPSVDEIFEKGDTDGDGYISETEHETMMEQMGGPPPGGGSVQNADSEGSLIEALLKALDGAEDTISSSTEDASEEQKVAAAAATLLSAALKTYMESGMYGLAQGDQTQSLLGNTLYA